MPFVHNGQYLPSNTYFNQNAKADGEGRPYSAGYNRTDMAGLGKDIVVNPKL